MNQQKNQVWERIEKIMKAKGWRQQDLCSATGIRDSTLSVFKKRASENPNATLSADTASRIAHAADVSADWLLTGRVSHGRIEDPYQTRAPVVAMARTMGVSEGAIAALEMERLAGGDPGEDYWYQRLHEYIGRARDLERRLLPDDDTFGEHEDG